MNAKQLCMSLFVISRIIQIGVIKCLAEAYNTYRDLDFSGDHKNRIS